MGKKNTIDLKTTKSPRIKILLVDTDRRAYAARLAMAFAALDCEVSAVCTAHHPIETVSSFNRRFGYSARHPLVSLLSAIEATLPDLVIPCDDRAVEHLQNLCDRYGDRNVRVGGLIERSLGPPGSYPVVSSRYGLLELARREGIRVPATYFLQNAKDVDQLKEQLPFPWILKADGTWGGSGVRIAENVSQAERLMEMLKGPCGLRRATKRLLVNRDAFYLRDWWQGVTRPVIAQAFVPGRPANCAVACWEGKVLAQVNVEVLATSWSTGPANVVRSIQSPDMTMAAERISRKLHLSGFFGLDFVLEEGSGEPYLVEMNPRCTPLCHVQFGTGLNLVAALHAQVSGKTIPAMTAQSVANHEVIAYFPQLLNGSQLPQSSFFHDFPHGEPELARALLRPYPEKTLLYRIVDYLSTAPSDGTSALSQNGSPIKGASVTGLAGTPVQKTRKPDHSAACHGTAGLQS